MSDDDKSDSDGSDVSYDLEDFDDVSGSDDDSAPSPKKEKKQEKPKTPPKNDSSPSKKTAKKQQDSRPSTGISEFTLSSDSEDESPNYNRRRSTWVLKQQMEELGELQKEERTQRQTVYNQEIQIFRGFGADEFEGRRQLLLARDNNPDLIDIHVNKYSVPKMSKLNLKDLNGDTDKDDNQSRDGDTLSVDDQESAYSADFEDEERKSSVACSPSNAGSPANNSGRERREEDESDTEQGTGRKGKPTHRTFSSITADEEEDNRSEGLPTPPRTPTPRVKSERHTCDTSYVASCSASKVVKYLHVEKNTQYTIKLSKALTLYNTKKTCNTAYKVEVSSTMRDIIWKEFESVQKEERENRKKIVGEQKDVFKFLIDVNKLSVKELEARKVIEDEALSFQLKKWNKLQAMQITNTLEREESEKRDKMQLHIAKEWADIFLPLCQKQEELHRQRTMSIEGIKWKNLRSKELQERRHARERERQRTENEVKQQLKKAKMEARRRERQHLAEKRRKIQEFQPANPTEFQKKEVEERKRLKELEEKAERAKRQAYRDDWLKRIDKHQVVYDRVRDDEVEEVEATRDAKMAARERKKRAKAERKREKQLLEIQKKREKMEADLQDFEAEMEEKRKKEEMERKKLEEQFETRRLARLEEEKEKALRKKRKLLGLLSDDDASLLSSSRNEESKPRKHYKPKPGSSSFLTVNNNSSNVNVSSGDDHYTSNNSRTKKTQRRNRSRRGSSSSVNVASPASKTPLSTSNYSCSTTPTPTSRNVRHNDETDDEANAYSDDEFDEYQDDFEEEHEEESDGISAEQNSNISAAAYKDKQKQKRQHSITSPTKDHHHLPSIAPLEPKGRNHSYKRNKYEHKKHNISTVPTLPAIR